MKTNKHLLLFLTVVLVTFLLTGMVVAQDAEATE